MTLAKRKDLVPKCMVLFMLFGPFFAVACHRTDAPEKKAKFPPFQWEYASPESQGMSSEKLDKMSLTLAEKGTKKLLIIKNDKIVYEWFAEGWEGTVRSHYTASLAKALVGGMSLAAALDDGYLTLDQAACRYIPQWKDDYVKSKITIRQLATHTSGLMDAEGTGTDHFDLPGWKGQFWLNDPDPFSVSRDSALVRFTPGEKYAYSNPGIAMLTYGVTASLKNSEYSDIRTYLRERIFGPIGVDEHEYTIGYGKTYEAGGLKLVPSWGGGDFTAKAIARIGLLMLHKGKWQGKQIIDSSAIDRVTGYSGTALPTPFSGKGKHNIRDENNPIPATTAGWYSNFDGVWEGVPRDAFGGAGAGNQLLVVIPSLNMVVIRMGENLYNASEGEGFWLGSEKYLLNPLMDATEEPPYPQSSLSVEFAPPDAVLRMAKGGDNWPVTWADDDNLYTAYGDGNGFLPYTAIRFSLGFAKVSGIPPSINGLNLHSATGERVGDGKHGVKASGMLMVDGVLYMLIRNPQSSSLMWSDDHGATWEQSDWKFDVSFGAPTFLNYGKNYAGARDEYVYIYSHDEASAYKNSDHFVLARVPKKQLKDWQQYEFFAGYENDNQPKWSEDIRKRKPVFTNPGKCYRSGITYHKGLKKYLWCQTLQLTSGEHTDVRFKGGLGIFESPNPWGPWKTVYYTRDWDIGPGETSSIPTKWMDPDDKTCYLLFSGEDYFSVRKMIFGTLQTNER
ncbi:serine hydrolase [Parapedobacter tibetensis]|uniref:serine hydrolase n=1 Tax=Parapedobacter tibetensis TaxID=2972951 RepID=UPI00214D2F6C|nr:serine hydrolase [Parapedobacter tibetensis]